MADIDSPAFPGDTDLAAQALNAVRAGADPEAVKKLFLEEATKRGADPSKLTTDFINDSPAAAAPAAAVDKATKKQYADAISGEEPWDINVSTNRLERQDVGLKGLIAPTIQKNSPVGGNFGNVEGDSDTTAPRGAERLGYALAGTAGRGIAGLMGLAAPLAGDIPEASDEVFEQSKKLREWSDKKIAESVDRTFNGKARGGDTLAGNLIGGILPTTMLGEQMNAGMEKLDEGKSLSEAEAASAKTGVMNELMLGAGKLGIQKAGFLPYVTRAAAQAGTNVGLTVADKKLEGEDIATSDIATAAGMGLGGALFHEGKAGELPKRTGDEAMDAGVDAAKKATGDIDFSHDEPIPAPKKTTEAKARERDEIKARADALGVSVKEYKEATGYDESAPPPAESKPLADQIKEAESRRSVLDDDNLTQVAPQLPAYHGTPHEVDEFSTSKIGTGEGNQVYGHGLYFAGDEKVAEHYASTLGGVTDKTRELQPTVIKTLKAINNLGFDSTQEALRAIRVSPKVLGGVEPATRKILQDYRNSFGNKYQVELKPEEHEYLDWDRPLSEQSDQVKGALKKLGIDENSEGVWDNNPTTGKQVVRPLKGHEIYRKLGGRDSPRAKQLTQEGISKVLHDAGIPGIKYKDGTSRGKEGGTHNYVIFNDKDVAITHKNGQPVPQKAAAVPKIHGMESTTRGALLKREGNYEDPLGFIYDKDNNLLAQPKVTARARTQEEIAPHIAPNAQRALKQQSHEMLNKLGNAHAVAEQLAKGKDDIAALARKVIEHNDLRATKFTAVNPEDLLTSRSGNAQSLIGLKGGDILGLRGLHGEGIFVRGAGFRVNGLDRVTIMHEILHAALQDKIRAAAEGKIKDPRVIKAIHELENMRDALQRMDGNNPRRPGYFDHAMTNIDELTSIAGTDPGMRAYLKGKTLGEVSAWSKLKDIWRRVIGAERMNKPAFDHVMEHINTLVEHKDRGVDPRDVAAHSVRPKEEEKLQAPRGRAKQMFKEGLASGGIEPKVAAAEQAKQGLIAEGDAEAVQAANRLGAVTTKANKDLVSRSLAGDVNAFKKLDAKTKAVVRDEYKRNFDRSLAIAREIHANPNATPEMRAIASKILENAGKYQMDVYTARVIPRSMKDKYALAKKAEKKLAANKPLSNQERKALNHVDEAKKFLEQYYLPDTEKLKTFKTPHLEDLYHYYTGKRADESLGSFDTKAERKEALMGEIAKGMRDTVNRSGEVENLLKNVMGIGDKASSLHNYYNNMRAGSDIYSVHTKVPDALKQLWEPVLDPVARNVASIRQQYNYIANLHAQNMLAKDGMGSIFTKERGHSTHNARIEGSKMGALQGLYTTPDVKRAIDSIFTLHSMTGDALDTLVASRTGTEFLLNRIKWLADSAVAPAASFTKLMSVVGNIGNYANNFVGSAAQIMANGNINPVAMAKGMRDAASMIGIGLKKNMSESVRDMFKYRVAEYSHIAELKGSEHSNMVASILKRSAEAANPLQALQQEISAMANGGRHAAAVVKELYGAMDFWTKAANWHNELGFWKDHFESTGQKMSEDALKQFVAQRVNATNITPSAAGKLFRGLERYGVTRFGTYYAEVARTLKNNAIMGLADARDGFNMMMKGDLKNGGMLLQHGLKRVAGTGISIFAHNQHFAWMAKGIASAAGLVATQMGDDDPLKKYMKQDNFLGSMDPLFISDPAHPEDGQFVYDLSHADPFGPITMPIKTAFGAMSKLADGDKDGAKEDFKQFLNQSKGLYLSNALWGQIAKQYNGSGARLEQENKALYDKIGGWLTEAGFEVKGANRAINAAESTLPKSVTNYIMSKNPDIVSEKLKTAIMAGVGVSKVDVANDISNYMSGKALTDIKDAKNTYASLMKQDYTSSPERLEKSFVKGLKASAEPYDKMRTAVQAAKKMGTDDIELMRRMKAAGLSARMSYMILENDPITVDVLTTDLKKDFQRDLIDTIKDPAKQEEAINRFIYNNEQLIDLMGKYQNKNIEELQ